VPRWRALFPALLLVLASCAQDAPYDTLDPAGPVAERIDALFMPVFWIAAAIFVVVEGAILLFAVAFREKEGRPLPRQTHGNTILEVIWTVIPALILTVVGFLTVKAIFELRAEASDALQVRVVASQWWWQFEYPELGVVTANELHIPVGRAVTVSLESRDVIHSFWVPRLAGKQDIVPGRTHFLTFQAVEPDTYLGQCVEFCGLSHALMRLTVVAQTEEDFQAWADGQAEPAAQPAEDLAAQGQQVFSEGECVTCHVLEGVSDPENPVGPDLTHFASRSVFAGAILENTPENVATWLRNPPAVKPGSKMPNLGLTPDEIQALVAYLESLK
jgi:cytochrome c oxidase subunit 2